MTMTLGGDTEDNEMNDIEKIAANIRHLSDWYKKNKPAMKYVSIASKDAKKIRELWRNEVKRPDIAMVGFKVDGDQISWGSWELRER